MKTAIKCKMCDKEFSIMSSNFFAKEVEINNEKLVLLVLKCPFCNYEIVAQIDSVKTRKILDDLINRMRLTSKWKFMNGNLTKRQSAQLKNLNTQLDKERKLLVKKYKDILLQKYNLDYYFDF